MSHKVRDYRLAYGDSLDRQFAETFCVVCNALMCSSTRVVGITSFGVSHLQQRSYRLRKVSSTYVCFEITFMCLLLTALSCLFFQRVPDVSYPNLFVTWRFVSGVLKQV